MADVYQCIKSCDLYDSAESFALDCIKSCIFSHTRCDLEDFEAVRDSQKPSVLLSISLAIALVPVTALFAGLTIGILGLDVVSLNVSAIEACWKLSLPRDSESAATNLRH